MPKRPKKIAWKDSKLSPPIPPGGGGGDDITLKRVADLEKRLDVLEARVSVVNVPVLDAVDTLRRDTLAILQGFERRMAERFDQVDAGFAHIDQRLDLIAESTAKAEGRLEAKMEATEERLIKRIDAGAAVAVTGEQMQREVAGLGTRVDAIDRKVGAILDELRARR